MTDYYIDPVNGDNANDGQSVSNAVADFEPFDAFAGKITLTGGDTVYMRDTGDILTPKEVDFRTLSGSEGNYITLTNYQDESPVIDFQNATFDHGGQGIYIQEGSHYHLSNFTVKNADRHNVVFEDGGSNATHDIVIENVETTQAGQGGTSGAGFTALPGTGTVEDVTILNCEVHHNLQAGGNADGINVGSAGVKRTVIKHTVAYHNGDDGFDFFEHDSGTDAGLIRDCIAHSNGRNDDGSAAGGDGSGFKMSGGAGTGGHTWKRCLAWYNYNSGFNNNQGDQPQTIYNCAAYDNGHGNNVSSEAGFRMFSDSDTAHVMRNNWAYQNSGGATSSEPASLDDSFNSWDLGGVSISDADFVSVTEGSDAYLRLAPSSEMIDAGTPVDLPFEGDKPDLGPYPYYDSATRPTSPARIEKYSDFEATNRFVLEAPNGDRYNVQVDSAGTLSTEGPL